MPGTLKNIAPRSLYGRFLLIILLPTVLAQAIAVYMFYERHWSSMTRNLASALSGEVAYIAYRVEHTGPEDYPALFNAVKGHLDIEATFTGNDGYFSVPAEPPADYIYFERYTRERLGADAAFAYRLGDERLHVRIPLQDGRKLYLNISRKRLANPTTYIFVLWMTGSSALLLIISVLFLRNQVRSIVRLTQAAEHFGRGQDMPDFKPQGAKEVRRAAIAFIEMRERIKRLLTRRTQMLAGVSHDLRTPLTRMRLQLELMLNTKGTKALKEDVAEMEKMLEGYLDFARGESGEIAEDIELCGFLNRIITGYPNDARRITNEIAVETHVHGQPSGLKRVLGNLIENGLRYAGNVWISAELQDKHLYIHVEDDGPGIQEAERDNVFQPFYRLEKSRNAATGGVGLGLSIARDIAHLHGGEITLGHSAHGGLKASLALPV